MTPQPAIGWLLLATGRLRKPDTRMFSGVLKMMMAVIPGLGVSRTNRPGPGCREPSLA